MRKSLFVLGAIVFALALAIPVEAKAAGAEVRMAPLGRSYAPPPIRNKEGWLTISNRDWNDYTFVETRKGRAYLSRGGTYGGIVIPSGATVTVALEKDTWEITGETGDKLKVKVREGRTSTVSLEPFGYVGNTGLRGISNDGDKVRDEILFAGYAPPVVVQRPPVIIERPTPPPPPVIINRPPVIVHRPPSYRPPPPPRPRPPRPSHRDQYDGWGFNFGFGSSR